LECGVALFISQFISKDQFVLPTFVSVYPPTQETTPACRNFHRERKPKTALRCAGTVLAVDECVNGRYTISAINVSCFGGFRSQADDPPKTPPAKELVCPREAAMAEVGPAGRLA
jgi:hypothetical protein